ncbi:MAG: hypothetical protein JXA23_11185 [Bacteroidales bacterium]|nr:hypothetical protein [Bacteroidales bacterium]
METVFSKQLLRLIGILFLAGSLWFAANSADTIFKVARKLISPKELIVKQSEAASRVSGETIAPESPSATPITFPMCLIIFALMAGWLVLQLLSRWRRRPEFQMISVFLVFIALLAMIRNFGWQVELYFSLLILISVGLYFFGHHLSHNGLRIHFFFTWGLFSLWWLLKLMINGQRDQLPEFFVFSSLIFLSFHLIQLFRGFAGHKVLSHYIEVSVIAFNVGFYFILVIATLLKFYGKQPLFFFALALTVGYSLSLLAMEYFHQPFRKRPFLASALVLISLLLPLLFWTSKLILLAGSISMLSLFFSRQTKDQPSIIIGLVLVGVMMLVFLKDLVFSYIPAAFAGGLAGNQALFYRGLIAGLFIALVAFLDRIQLRKLEISYSRKWFDRKRYLVLLKGIFLTGLYFGLFYLWQYSCMVICGSGEVALISWFSYHCLFFIIAIPWLAAQRSSFLPVAILVSVILTFIYPSLLTLKTETILGLYVREVPVGLAIFPLHYMPAALFLVYLSIVLKYAGKAFKGSTLAKRIFLIYAIVMVLDILVSELVFTGAAINATSQLEVNEIETRLLRLPATLVLFVSGAVILVWGFIRQKRFGRTLALIVLLLAAFKLIYFDMKSLSMITRVLLLFATGSLFIVLSLVYRMVQNAFRKSRRHGSYHTSGKSMGSEELPNPPSES